jgi:hypothetical protein
MTEQSCSGKSSFSQTLGPAIPEETASTANDFAAASLNNPYTGSAIMPAKRLRILLAEISSPVDHAIRIARRRVDRQHEIFSRSYGDQLWLVQRTRSSALSSDHPVPYQDDEQRISSYCSPNRRGVPRILRVWRFPALPPIRWQSSITSSHNHCLARKAQPESANWNTLRSNITGI